MLLDEAYVSAVTELRLVLSSSDAVISTKKPTQTRQFQIYLLSTSSCTDSVSAPFIIFQNVYQSYASIVEFLCDESFDWINRGGNLSAAAHMSDYV